MKAQILLTQAEDCIDAAIDYLDSEREQLSDHGVTNYVQSVCRMKLADAIGELHKVRRMLPGYERGASFQGYIDPKMGELDASR